eukprot:scaffold10874_cov85-Phaeocystis_antarctica.AAC.1
MPAGHEEQIASVQQARHLYTRGPSLTPDARSPLGIGARECTLQIRSSSPPSTNQPVAGC